MPKQVVLAGFHAVNARAKLNPDSIRVVYVEASRRDKRMQQCKDRLAAAGVKVMQADAKRLEGMAPGIPHQGIVALADELKQTLDFDTLLDSITPDTLLLVLDGVTDPRNFGACLRVADAAGVQAVIAPRDRSASFSPAAAKAAGLWWSARPAKRKRRSMNLIRSVLLPGCWAQKERDFVSSRASAATNWPRSPCSGRSTASTFR